MDAKFEYEIVRNLGVLSTRRFNGEARNTEINIVSWNRHDPKFDIRIWNEDHSSMSKGISLTGEEIRKLYKAIEPYCKNA